MSQLDVVNAKRALAYRLKEWGAEGDPFQLADGFIDDLVRIGWQMSAERETRIYPPRADEECEKHPGQHMAPFCGLCRVEAFRTESDPTETQRRKGRGSEAAIAAAKAAVHAALRPGSA